MRNSRPRRFRPRSNKNFSRRPSNGVMKNNGMQHLNGQRNHFVRNHIPRNPHSVEKIIEKYKVLAKEALSTGDKTLSENYLQHSDHYSRLLSEMDTAKLKNNLKEENKDTAPTEKNISITEDKK